MKWKNNNQFDVASGDILRRSGVVLSVMGFHVLAIIIAATQLTVATHFVPAAITVSVIEEQGSGAGKSSGGPASSARGLSQNSAQSRPNTAKLNDKATKARPRTAPSEPSHSGQSSDLPKLSQQPLPPIEPEQVIDNQAVTNPTMDPATTLDDAAILAMVARLTGGETSTDAVSQGEVSANHMSGAGLGQAAMGGQGVDDGCPIVAQLQQAFTQDAAVRAAIDAIPVDARSVANAVQLWNGAWLGAFSAQSDDALIALRQTLDTIVENATPQCQTALHAGPVFFIAADQTSGQTVVVLGSGSWRWADLVTPKTKRPWFWSPL